MMAFGVHLIFFRSKLFFLGVWHGLLLQHLSSSKHKYVLYVYLVYLVLVGIIYLTYVFHMTYLEVKISF
jgi:hypothetical protein